LWNKKRREWTSHLLKYKQAIFEIQNFCKPKGIFVDAIPRFVFEVAEYAIPFTDESKQKLIDFDYECDVKPKLS
jgi:hypothetical protein